MLIPPRIVDAHHHLWDLGANSYPWLTTRAPHPMFGEDYDILRRNYLAEDYLADIADLPIAMSVHLQADWDPADPVGESRWLGAVAERPAAKGFPHGIVAYADFFDERVNRILERHAEIPRVRGVRQTLHHRKGQPLQNETWLRNFGLLKKYGFSFDLQVYPRQAEHALNLVDAHPDVQFVLSHCGLPQNRSGDGIECWRNALREFSKRHNVVCKMSGFGMMNRSWQIDDIRPIILDIIGVFGCGRCFFGSNFPVDRFAGSYKRTWLAFFEVTNGLSASERNAVFWANPVRVYRLPG